MQNHDDPQGLAVARLLAGKSDPDTAPEAETAALEEKQPVGSFDAGARKTAAQAPTEAEVMAEIFTQAKQGRGGW